MTKSVLIVGPAESPHFHSWVRAASQGDLKIRIFPSDRPNSDNLKSLLRDSNKRNTKVSILFKILSRSVYLYRVLDKVNNRKWRISLLRNNIKSKKLAVINLHELQSSGNLLLDIKNYSNLVADKVIICSSWGSDLSLYSQVKSHQRALKSLMEIADVLTTERKEEEAIARNLGFDGVFQKNVYTSVGTSNFPNELTPSSSRNKIMIKGYQDIPGRALNAIKAIEISQDFLKGWEIAIFSASESVVIASELLANQSGLNIRIVPKQSKDKFLEEYKNTRIYIGLAISDGLSTSMVEAMNFGAFPIQSETSAASDFIEHGVNGFVVDPWDIKGVANLVMCAAADHELVDSAQITNREIVKKRYDFDIGVLKIIEILKQSTKKS